jgi:hypothetical protein
LGNLNSNWGFVCFRESALDKAASMATHIAYPEELLEEKKVADFYAKVQF